MTLGEIGAVSIFLLVIFIFGRKNRHGILSLKKKMKKRVIKAENFSPVCQERIFKG